MQYIENDFLKVGVADHGAELSSIYDKEKGHEVIWTADPKYWKRHAPVLFPFVGKVNGGQYRYRGKSYPMGQHGFARDMDFTLVSATDNEITYVLGSDAQTRAKYPFDWKLTITHRLEGRTLTVQWQVTDTSDSEDLYFAIGGHPAFNVPADPGQKKSDYWLYFDGVDRADYILIDPEAEAADPEHPQTLSTDGGYVKITDTLFDNDAFIFDNGEIQKVALCYPDKTPYVSMDLTGCPSLGVWSKPHSDAPFVCLEPWIGRVDNKGFAGELPEKFGEQHLTPGAVFNASYTITIG